MIDSILKKDSKIISKVSCLEQIEELRRKRLVLMTLIKEFAISKEVEMWDLSPIPIFCESLVYVARVTEMLEKLYNKFKDKNEIRVTSDESIIYATYCSSLVAFSQELLHIYNINLKPEKNIQ